MRSPIRRGGAARAGFTLVEALLAVALAGTLMVGISTFFGDFLSRFAHQEDTLSGAHQAQVLLEWLRRDVEHIDGRTSDPTEGVSAASETGTTFPKFWVHACHIPGGTDLQLFPRSMASDDAGVDVAHPAGAGLLGPTRAAARVQRQLSRIENAYAWTGEREQDSEPGALVLNVRDGTRLERVVYTYEQRSGSITRTAADGTPRRIVNPALQSFLATPYVEMVYDPDAPDAPPRIVKTWLEVQFRIRSGDPAGHVDGQKMRSRALDLSTRLFPFHLNSSLHSDWSP